MLNKCKIKPVLSGFNGQKGTKVKRVFKCVLIAALLAATTGCRQNWYASYNVSKEADNFNVCRRITVINSRTDAIIYELEGVFSLSNGYNNELEVICQTGENEYKKHFIYLTNTVLYVVEDMSGADVSPYHYEVTFYPQMVGGVDVDVKWEN